MEKKKNDAMNFFFFFQFCTLPHGSIYNNNNNVYECIYSISIGMGIGTKNRLRAIDFIA